MRQHCTTDRSSHLQLYNSYRGCETYVVREGYEGLVRGNGEGLEMSPPSQGVGLCPMSPQGPDVSSFINSLRFGDGELLRDGTGDHDGGRTLKGRYIVKVGWDDVRGWYSEVRFPEVGPIEFSSIGCGSIRVAHSLGQPDQPHSGLSKVVWLLPTT